MDTSIILSYLGTCMITIYYSVSHRCNHHVLTYTYKLSVVISTLDEQNTLTVCRYKFGDCYNEGLSKLREHIDHRPHVDYHTFYI